MRRYLDEFLSDRRVIDYPRWLWQPLLQGVILTRRPFSSGANYRKIWNREADESPLLTITRGAGRGGGGAACRATWRPGRRRLRHALRQPVDALGHRAAAGRRAASGIVFFPLYPQYSAPTTATANDQAFRALMALRWQPAVRTVPAYHDHPLYIEALAQSVEAAYAGLDAAAGRAGHELSRHAGALPARGRSLSLPLPEDDAAAARAAGVRTRTRSSSPSSRASGREEWLQALHGRGGGAAGRRRAGGRSR